MKALGDLQFKLGAPHELMMLSSHPLSHQDFEVFIGVPQRELLAPFEGFYRNPRKRTPRQVYRARYSRGRIRRTLPGNCCKAACRDEKMTTLLNARNAVIVSHTIPSSATSIHRPIAAEERLLRVMRRIGLLLLSACRAGSTLPRGLGFRFLRFRLHVVHLPRRGAGGFRLRLESDIALGSFAL